MSILSGLISSLFLTSEDTGIGAIREANRYMQQVLDERRHQQPRQNDENTLSSLMSRVPTLESTNGFRSLRTFDVSNLSRGHQLFYFVVVNSICFILQKFTLLTKMQYFLDRL